MPTSHLPRPTRSRLRLEPLEDRTVPSAVAQMVPNDPLYPTTSPPPASTQWNLPKVGAPDAWDVTRGSTKVVVADTDSGIDYTHPDLYQNVWINQAEIPASRLKNLTHTDDDGLITFRDLNYKAANGIYPNQGIGKIADENRNGYIDAGDLLYPMGVTKGADNGKGGWADRVNQDAATETSPLGRGFVDDLVGWDFFNNDNNPWDDNGHGTHTAGTIGAVGNNALGVAGLAWEVQIMPVKIIGASSSQGASDLATPIKYSVVKGARVSNNSWGVWNLTSTANTALSQAVAFARDNGQLFVAAAMNNALDNDTSVSRAYPASYDFDNIISVAATDANDVLASFSNYGATSVDLAAPGVDVWSTVRVGRVQGSDDYGMGSGTSMATPHVTGSAALLLASDPTLTYQQVRNLILANVDTVPSLAGKVATGGRLNVARALAAAPAMLQGPTPTLTSLSTGTTGDATGSESDTGVEAGSVAILSSPTEPMDEPVGGLLVDQHARHDHRLPARDLTRPLPVRVSILWEQTPENEVGLAYLDLGWIDLTGSPWDSRL